MKGRKRERVPSSSSSDSSAADSSVAESSASSSDSAHSSENSSFPSSSSEIGHVSRKVVSHKRYGKGKNIPSPSSESKSADIDAIDFDEVCPRFSAVVSEETTIKLEDLDSLQYELENLLVHVSKRKIFMERELVNIESSDGHVHKSSQSVRKRFKASDKAKKAKIESNKEIDNKTSEYDFLDSPADDVKTSVGVFGSGHTSSSAIGHDPTVTITASGHIIKNDSPDMFWSLVNSFCSVPTDEHLKVIEGMLALYADKEKTSQLTGQSFPSPNSQAKALAERQQEQEQAYLPKNKKGKQTGKSHIASHVAKNQSNQNHGSRSPVSLVNADRDSYGPLTRRLVSALLESRAKMNIDELWDEPSKNDPLSVLTPPTTGPAWKNIELSQAAELEEECERLLSSRGLLMMSSANKKNSKFQSAGESASASSSCAASTASCSSSSGTSSDDETNEFARLQRELRHVMMYNEQSLRRLLEAGRRAQRKARLLERLANVEIDVKESYRRLVALKKASARNKTPMGKKEKDQAWKAIRERKTILQELLALK